MAVCGVLAAAALVALGFGRGAPAQEQDPVLSIDEVGDTSIAVRWTSAGEQYVWTYTVEAMEQEHLGQDGQWPPPGDDRVIGEIYSAPPYGLKLKLDGLQSGTRYAVRLRVHYGAYEGIPSGHNMVEYSSALCATTGAPGQPGQASCDPSSSDLETRAVTVMVTNVDEAGEVSLTPAGPVVGTVVTASLTDLDGGVTNATWQWASAASATGTFADIAGATDAAYTPVAADKGRYLRASASYDDDHGRGKSASAVSAAAVGNSVPLFDEGAHTTREVAENTAAGEDIGVAVTATEADKDTLTYTLGGTDAASFDINAQTGQLSTKAVLDHETKASYTVTVTASDGTASAEIAVTVMVTNVDEAGEVSLTPAGPVVGTVVTASLTDLDGGVTNATWQWASAASATGTFADIAGATDAAYTPVAADKGRYLRASASYDDDHGRGKSASAVSAAAVGNSVPALYRKVSGSILPRAARDILDGTISAVAGRMAVLDARGEASGSASLTLGGYAVRPAAAGAQGWLGADERVRSGGADDSSSVFGAWGAEAQGTESWGARETPGVLEPRQFLARSSFLVGAGGEHPRAPSLWGMGRYRSLSWGESEVDWRGDLWGLRLGVDGRPHPQWLTGVSLSWSEGWFDWDVRDGESRSGRYALTLGAVWPYAGWVSHDRVWRVWGLAGMGEGWVEVSEEAVQGSGAGAGPEESDVSLVGAALGVSRELWRGAGTVAGGGAAALHAKAEVALTQAEQAGSEGGSLEALTVDTQRVRFGVEASTERALAAGRRLVLSLALSGRGDFGDEIEGGGSALGVEIGPGLRWLDPGRGLVLEGRGRLLAVSDDATREWGVELEAGYDPGVRGRGIAFDLFSGYGVAGSTAGGLWEREMARSALFTHSFEPRARQEMRLGYGLALGGGRGLLTPYVGHALSGADDRRTHLGATWSLGEGLHLDLVAEHLGTAHDSDARVSLTLRSRF